MSDSPIGEAEVRQANDDPLLNRMEARLRSLEQIQGLQERLITLEQTSGVGDSTHTRIALGAGFVTFGATVGLLAGLTQSEIVQPLIAGLIALSGGSLLAFVHKLSPSQQQQSGLMLAALSVGLVLGVLSGIVVREHQLLGTARRGEAVPNQSASADSAAAFGYLRSEQARECNTIDAARTGNSLTAEQAYEAMYSACLRRSR